MKKNSGFTLIEILTVIVILGVLAGLAVPVYVGQVEKARGSEAIDHLRLIYKIEEQEILFLLVK